jgi:hypothetical protein
MSRTSTTAAQFPLPSWIGWRNTSNGIFGEKIKYAYFGNRDAMRRDSRLCVGFPFFEQAPKLSPQKVGQLSLGRIANPRMRTSGSLVVRPL